MLNAAYAIANIQFYIKTVTRTANNDWFQNCRTLATTIKASIAADPTSSINVYTCG